MMQPNSQSFQVIADLLRHIESLNISTDQYGILDGGETLELSKALHTRLKETSEFQAFENIGGNWYCFDDNEWEVA
jgi:hypothetical protein